MPQAMQTHIFLDNSNIFGGAQSAARRKEGAIWLCVRIDYQQLFRLLLHNKYNRKTSMLAGSVPPGNEALWRAARDAGFDTTLLRRVDNDTGRLVEQGVDEAIHLRIANILLDSDDPGIIVLATGDGKKTEQGSSFPQQVRRAAKRGWKVEIWSWTDALSPVLRNTQAEFPGLVKIFRLDEWYHGIVFLKGGTYYLDGQTVQVATRTCGSLNLTETAFGEAQGSQ
jgi:hypothetical protein